MPIIANLFDGTKLRFPDDTDQSVIDATVKRVTLERQSGNVATPEEGEPKGSAAYETIKSLVDPLRPYVEPAVDYVGEQADLAIAGGKKGVANLQTALKQSQVAGLMELQEADFAKYGKDLKGMPPDELKKHMETRKAIESKLGDVAQLGLERKAIEKQYGVRKSTKAFNELSQSKEYQEGSFLDKMSMIGSKLADDPFGIITDIGLESLPQSFAVVATAVAARTGNLNPKIAAGLGGSSSAMMDFGNTYAQLREQGMDHTEAWEKAGVKSGIVGLFDAASFYTAGRNAGKIVNDLQKGAVKETAKTVGKELGTQAALGAAGEGVGSAVIGQEIDPLELTKEAIGEMFGAPLEAVGTYQQKVAEARAQGKPDPEPPSSIKKAMEEKGFTFTRKITAPSETPSAEPIVEPTEAEAQAEEAMAEAYAGQDIQAMIDELEGRKREEPVAEPKVEEPVVAEAPAVAEAPVAEAPAVQTEEVVAEQAPAVEPGKAVTFSQLKPEDQKTIREMEVAKNKIAKEKKLFPEFLRRQGIQPSEKADLGLEKIRRPDIFKVKAPSFDELTSRAISEGFMIDTGDDVQNVAQFREYVADYLSDGVINTGPDAAREGQIRAIEDAVDRIYRSYEPDFALEETTPEMLRAQEEAQLQEQEQVRLAEEQQRREQERQEIAQLSERAAEDFQLGRTAEEDLMGQSTIFEQPELTDEQVDAEMKALAERDQAEAERIRREGGEDADIPFLQPTMAREMDTAQDLADATNEEIRAEKIRELQGIKQRMSAITRRFIGKVSKKGDMERYEELYKRASALEQEVYELYEPNTSPEAFLAKAAKALSDGQISREVYDVIDSMFKKNPRLLDGLKLSIKKGEGRAAGQFLPYERIVRLYKDTDGVDDPRTIRHEITHTLEQMMSRDARKALAARWRAALEKASKAEKSEKGILFFDKVNEFLKDPNKQTMEAAIAVMPDYSYYQYIAPSEYWAVNAEELMASYLGGAWQRFKAAVRALYEGLKNVLGIDNDYLVHRVFREVIKSGQRKTSSMINDYIQATVPLYNPHRNFLGGKPPLASWNNPDESKLANFIYKIQDKMVDLKDVQKAIAASIGQIAERWDAYMKEELYHGRTAKRIEDFLRNELSPILKDMKKANIDIQDFDDYLHNRHAEERNIQIAKVNPNMPDGGSGIFTADAKNYLNSLDPAKRKIYEQLAKKVDLMVQGTQKILVNEGLEEQSTIDAWNAAYKNYVPLMREDLDFVHAGSGFGQGYATRGKTSRRATGSLKDVADIFANIAMQRERAIVRAEKARVGRALYGMAIKFPNPGFWLPVNPDAIKDAQALANELITLGLSPADAMNFIKEPTTQDIDPRTGLVVNRVNVNNRYSDNVFPIKVNGKDRFIFFNPSDPRAMRMIKALKNMDVDNLSEVVGIFARITRWIASMNTQYNPVFGAWNFTRDVGGAMLNLSTTPINDKKAQVFADTFPALRAIYKDLRLQRKGGQPPQKQWVDLFERFQKAGGQTGYRDQFAKNRKQASIIERELDNLNKGNVRKFVDALGGWLSDYNDAMENAVRLAAFKAALDKGFSDEKAASIAKNLTVNFNRKGQLSANINSLYAFFNAAVQGTARIYETLRGPAGKKIIAGGMLLGSIQALALALAGFDDDEPPEYLKDKNIIIPIGGKKYVVIPMPLGFNAIPGMGRRLTEMVLSGGQNMPKKMIGMMGMVLDAFNPLGSSSSLANTLAPTFMDPFVSVDVNRDPFGRPIYKEDKTTNPTPGYSRSREGASTISKNLAEFLNWASGGSQFKKGAISPTADEIDFIVGQYTGGVGREISKAVESGKALFTGEKVAPYRKPIVGKIVGDGDSPQAIQNKFYSNITELAQHENEIKGRMKEKRSTSDYYKKYPEARMYNYANTVENQISQINRDRKELIERKADRRMIDNLDQRKTRLMQSFNRQYNQRKKQ